jgi:glycine/sarcosine N-methyltransferase
MSFYDEIAEHYDFIFPFSLSQLEFVKTCIGEPYHDKEILDVGCGTGDLAIALARSGFKVTAIDSDPEMLRRAMEKVTPGSPVTLAHMDMRKISGLFSPSSFDVALSFGNTLVHLDGLREIESFLRGVKAILRDGGVFLLQILNYDHILDHDVRELPLIENEVIRFDRSYGYDRKKNRIAFRTRLTVKATGKLIENEIPLYPIRRGELDGALRKGGFTRITWYGSFGRDELTDRSLPLVVEAW